MTIVVDDKIPFIQDALHSISDNVIFLPGAEIKARDVHNADILVVRTRTHCNSQLLQDSKVRLLLTATIGYDHFDTTWLNTTPIIWYNCPGCNATSVAQYVECSLLLAELQNLINLKEATLGIIGVGHVGTAVMHRLQKQVKTVLLNDILPERCPSHDNLRAATLQEIAEQADIITFHTPLTHNIPSATWHLADANFFQQLKKKPVIINAARGGVVDESALLHAYEHGKTRAMIIDTWETEPSPHPELLQKAFIATPHIAGYSADGKLNATRICLKHIVDFMGLKSEELPKNFYPTLPPIEQSNKSPLFYYNPSIDSNALKQNPKLFEYLRGHYPVRREP